MILLISYVILAVGFSFLCSIAEAVLLSVSTSYVAEAEADGKPFAKPLRRLKEDVNSPLAVILTLNTVAHTVGAAGAGAQASKVFGSIYLGLFSAVLTLLILVFSEIIPKALGAHYWRKLAPGTAYTLSFLVRILSPFVALLNKLTQGLIGESTIKGLTRREFAAMAKIGEREGQLNRQEATVLQNLLQLRELRVRDVMTPRSVVFTLPEETKINEYQEKPTKRSFSRIPIYDQDELISGFILRSELLEAQNDTKNGATIGSLRRDLLAIIDKASVLQAFEEFIHDSCHIAMVVDEYGTFQGVISLEDILESLLGLEIIDESDTVEDMQALARRLGKLKRKKMGLDQ